MMLASQFSGDVIDAIRPDLEAFTSLWTALRVNYEGTNITRTVARLLHMYQPEEGILAYERLLRTLFVLLEDFDSDGLRLLVSMVSPPKNVHDDIVKEVFNRATGFVRINAPVFHKNTGNSTPVELNPELPYPRPETESCSLLIDVKKSDDLKMKINPNPTIQNDNNVVKNRMKTSPQVISQESSEVFRGFPPSEIFNTQSHVQSIKNFYRPAASSNFPFPQSPGGRNFINFGQIIGRNSGQIQQRVSGSGLLGSSYRPKWFQSPYLIQKNSYSGTVGQYQDVYWKTVNNQYVKVPVAKVNNFHQANINKSQGSFQQTLYSNNAQDYLKNRSSNTVTSGLLEKIQRHHSLQEVAVKRILTECEPPKNSTINTCIPPVSESDITLGSQSGNVEFKIVDLKKVNHINEKIAENLNLKNESIMGMSSVIGNLAIKSCDSKEEEENQEKKEKEDSKNVIESCRNIGEIEISVKNHSSSNNENFEEFTKEVRMRQRAIQEDIYKMDVVRSEILNDENLGDKLEADSSKAEILTPSDELKNSCKKFLDRSKTGEIIEVQKFPKTRALNEIHENSGVMNPSESNLWKLLTSQNISENKTSKIVENEELLVSEEYEKSSPGLEGETTTISPLEITANIQNKESPDRQISMPKRSIRKKKSEVLSTRGKTQKFIHNVSSIDHTTSNSQSDYNLIDPQSRGSELETRMKINLQADSTSRYQLPIGSSSSIGPATTLAELAAYKKQYYDALLSIQKAKVAVANSLAISSMGNTASFDPYYYNYLQQQHRQILQRRQEQILINQRFSHPRQPLPAVTPWFRTPDWRYPIVAQSRLPQRPQMLHPTSSMWHPGVGYLGRDLQNNNNNNNRTMQPQLKQQSNITVQASKPPIKRKKLEDIVGKLKETENNG